MASWDELYKQEGVINIKPAKFIREFMNNLIARGVKDILDLGCGTGRNAIALAKRGFCVHAIDPSVEAITIARSQSTGLPIDYRTSSLLEAGFPPQSMDFILASHSIDYIESNELAQTIEDINATLKTRRYILARMLSTKDLLYQAKPSEVCGFSHRGFCIQNGLPVHFFSEEEIRELFRKYKIETLKESSVKKQDLNHTKVNIPITRWTLLAYKR